MDKQEIIDRVGASGLNVCIDRLEPLEGGAGWDLCLTRTLPGQSCYKATISVRTHLGPPMFAWFDEALHAMALKLDRAEAQTLHPPRALSIHTHIGTRIAALAALHEATEPDLCDLPVLLTYDEVNLFIKQLGMRAMEGNTYEVSAYEHYTGECWDLVGRRRQAREYRHLGTLDGRLLIRDPLT